METIQAQTSSRDRLVVVYSTTCISMQFHYKLTIPKSRSSYRLTLGIQLYNRDSALRSRTLLGHA